MFAYTHDRWTGARRQYPPASAVLIAASALVASAARVVISRGTVRSDAPRPNTAGSSRRIAMSARQSPPSATATARSSRIFPGSCVARGLRHEVSAYDSAVLSPAFSAVRSRVSALPCDTTPVPVVATDSVGYNDVDLAT